MKSTRPAFKSTRLVGTFCALVTCACAWSGTLYVKADASGANNGSSWNDAFRELDSALAAAVPGDELWVAAATYRPDSQSTSFDMRSGVAVYGGFVGNETARHQRNFTTHLTTLSGDLGGDHCFHVVRAADVDSFAILDGFVITGGVGGSTEPDRDGGGILITGGSPTIANCTIRDNRARSGGGLFAQNCTLVLDACSFSINRTIAVGNGAGLAAENTTLVVTNCSFDGNACNLFNNSRGSGGAMYLANCPSVSVSNSSFRTNSAGNGTVDPYEGGHGGAIRGTSGTVLTLTNCLFQQNRAGDAGPTNGPDSRGGSGGALFFSGDLTARGCEFIDNRAGNGAGSASGDAWGGSGGALNVSGEISISQCRFVGNSAGSVSTGGPIASPGAGGGIVSNPGASLQIVNTLFAANRSGQTIGGYASGGALRADGFTALTNVTMVSNRGFGAGLYLGTNAQAALSNSIVWNNADANGGTDESDQIYGFNALDSVNYSCIQGLTGSLGGAGNIGSDPLFMSPAAGNYRLSADSPCIDAGQNATVPPGSTTDLAGELRFVDDPATPDTGAGTPPIVDIGAYEFSPAPCPADLDNDGHVHLSDLALLLSCFGRSGVPCADLDADGLTGLSDLALLLASFGQTCP